MLNRKSNEAPARAGIGTAHSTSATKTPARLPARRRIMASSFHRMTTALTRANVMPGGPLFNGGRENPKPSRRFSDAPVGAGPDAADVLSFRGDDPATSHPLGLRFLRGFRLARTFEGDRLANERLEGG